MIYFNEHDKFAAQWLRNLFPEATVDDRDIQQVAAADVAGFRRCHFFGGIGGWEYALQLAGFDGECWTGSCPCQPLSSAGKRAGEKDERHLWPEFYRLISECRPATIFGEQVASNDGLEWLDGVSLDLEELGYAVGASDLPAAGDGAPDPRQRFFWLAYAGCSIVQRWRRCGQASSENGAVKGEAQQRKRRRADACDRCETDRMANSANIGTSAAEQARQLKTQRGGTVDGLVHANGAGSFEGLETTATDRHWDSVVAAGSWHHYRIIKCRDGKLRRISAQPGDEPLAYGIPRDLGRRIPELRSVAKSARSNRVGRLRGYGNAIVPQLAATFIRAFMEATT